MASEDKGPSQQALCALQSCFRDCSPNWNYGLKLREKLHVKTEQNILQW